MRYKKIAAISAAIVGIITVAAAIGLTVSPIAQRSYVDEDARLNDAVHAEIAGALKSNKELGLENAITMAQNRAGDFEVLAIRMKAEGAPAADVRVVADQAQQYRDAARDFKTQLRGLRNQ